MATVADWAFQALGLWGNSPGVKLFQQVAGMREQISGLELEVASIKGERDEIDRQRDWLSNEVDVLNDKICDIRRLCDRKVE